MRFLFLAVPLSRERVLSIPVKYTGIGRPVV
jgi:hypothetical protein